MKLNDVEAIYAGDEVVTGIFNGADQWWASSGGTRRTVVMDMEQYPSYLADNLYPVYTLEHLTNLVGEGCYVSSVNWIDVTFTFTDPGSLSEPVIVAGMGGVPVGSYHATGNVPFTVIDDGLVDLDSYLLELTIEGFSVSAYFLGLTSFDVDIEEETLDYEIVNGYDTFPNTQTVRMIPVDPEVYPVVNNFDLYVSMRPSEPLSLFGDPDEDPDVVLTIDAITVNFTETCGEPIPRLEGRGYDRAGYINEVMDTVTEYEFFDYYTIDEESEYYDDITGYHDFEISFHLESQGDSLPALKIEFLGDAEINNIAGQSSFDGGIVISEDYKTVIVGASGTIEEPVINDFFLSNGYGGLRFQGLHFGHLGEGDFSLRVTPLCSDEEGEYPSFTIETMRCQQIVNSPVQESIILSEAVTVDGGSINLWSLISSLLEEDQNKIHVLKMEVDVACVDDGSVNSALIIGHEGGNSYTQMRWMDVDSPPDSLILGENRETLMLGIDAEDFDSIEPSSVTGFNESHGMRTLVYETYPPFPYKDTTWENWHSPSLVASSLNSNQVTFPVDVEDTLNLETSLGGTVAVTLWDIIEPEITEGNSVIVNSIEFTIECTEDGATLPAAQITTPFSATVNVTGGPSDWWAFASTNTYLGVAGADPLPYGDGFTEADGLATVTMTNIELEVSALANNTDGVTVEARDEVDADDSSYRIVDFKITYTELFPSSGEEFEVTEVRLKYIEDHSS